eukprot:gnl/TRDRNA2_/TRDRNA2_52574_c0_seq1.p1 gnl/TRDRNA2_/TRDRNA2_52574_c0~~gnl/TRDRNA2_/TRDRNA2_52574_c0_seq1.p1  ORF type:complete len:341 (+),score=66.27 gnl/TRDRNA2_/TRDRNA2_52574_c0_seq1:57-1079(+)
MPKKLNAICFIILLTSHHALRVWNRGVCSKKDMDSNNIKVHERAMQKFHKWVHEFDSAVAALEPDDLDSNKLRFVANLLRLKPQLKSFERCLNATAKSKDDYSMTEAAIAKELAIDTEPTPMSAVGSLSEKMDIIIRQKFKLFEERKGCTFNMQHVNAESIKAILTPDPEQKLEPADVRFHRLLFGDKCTAMKAQEYVLTAKRFERKVIKKTVLMANRVFDIVAAPNLKTDDGDNSLDTLQEEASEGADVESKLNLEHQLLSEMHNVLRDERPLRGETTSTSMLQFQSLDDDGDELNPDLCDSTACKVIVGIIIVCILVAFVACVIATGGTGGAAATGGR